MAENHRNILTRRCAAVLLGVLLLVLAGAWTGPERQMQLARRFLAAVLQGQYERAYQQLDPEMKRQTSPEQFRHAVEPLYQQGQKLGGGIELYRLGLRLGDNDDAQWFYAFKFKNDTAAAPLQLDVTFRDSAATQVLEYRLVPGRPR